MSKLESTTLPDSAVIQAATLTEEDLDLIKKCRGDHNRLSLLRCKVLGGSGNLLFFEGKGP